MTRAAALLLCMVMAGCATRGPVIDASGNAAVLAKAIDLRHAGRPEQAAAVIEKALLTDSRGDVALQGELARDVVYADPRRALDLIGQAFDPTNPDAKLLMVAAVAHDMIGDHPNAQALYERALKIAPTDSAILHNLDLSKKLAADERAQSVALAPRPKPVKRPVKIAPPAPVVVTAPEPASPTFRERWRLL